MTQTFYEITNSKIKFCSTEYNFDNKLHYLSYTEGYLGEINDFDNINTEDYSEVESFLKCLKIKYPDKINQRDKVRLSLLIDKDLRQLDCKRFENLLEHFLKTAKYATVFSGLGDFRDVKIKNHINNYSIDFKIIDKDLFLRVFLDLIRHCGLEEKDFIIN